jgi:peptidoglycan/LPS O-acetylase OafA/YrhL
MATERSLIETRSKRPGAPVPRGIIALRWVARGLSLLTILTIAMFAFGEPGTPTAKEWLLLAFFPIGLLLGLALAWWRELLGGIIAVGSILVFYAAFLVADGRLPAGPYFAILATPGVLFLILGLATRSHHRRAVASGK